MHVFLGPKGKSPLRHSDMDDLSAAVAPLTKYAIPQSTVYSLLTGSDQAVSIVVFYSLMAFKCFPQNQVLFIETPTMLEFRTAQITVFSPSKIQGTTGGHGLGGACRHIKAFWILPIPTSKEFLYWRFVLVGPTFLIYTGENTGLLVHKNHAVPLINHKIITYWWY